jgi:hypothetical protein
MNRFSFDELQRRDILTALGLWLTVEFVSFVVFPMLGVISPGVRLRIWFLLSLPLGIGGAILIGTSSGLMQIANQVARNVKPLYRILGQFGGWIGLVGVMFPFLMAMVEFFSTLKL